MNYICHYAFLILFFDNAGHMSLCISISNYALAENAAIIYVIMLFAGSN